MKPNGRWDPDVVKGAAVEARLFRRQGGKLGTDPGPRGTPCSLSGSVQRGQRHAPGLAAGYEVLSAPTGRRRARDNRVVIEAVHDISQPSGQEEARALNGNSFIEAV